MCHSFTFFTFFIAFRQFFLIECYASGGGFIWSRTRHDFIPIANVSTFEAYREEILAKSREKENHNFEGEFFKLGYFQVRLSRYYQDDQLNRELGYIVENKYLLQDNDAVSFYDNETKVTGAYGDMWNILADYSNFTLITKRVDELNVFNLSGHLAGGAAFMIAKKEIQIIPRIAYIPWYKNFMDLTTPIWVNRFKMYYQPEWKADTSWMFNIFSYKVWLSIILFFILLSVLGYLMEKILVVESTDKIEDRHYLHDHILYTFGTLCCQGSVPDTLDQRIQVFGLSKKIFAWLVMIVFSSNLISYMTNKKQVQPPFQDIESMLQNTEYTIGIYNGSIAYEEYMMYFQRLRATGQYNLSNRAWYTNSEDYLYKAVCSDKKNIVIFDLEDAQLPFNGRVCEIVPIGKSYFPTWISFGVPKGFPYKRTFDIGILKMREFGLADGLKKRWLKSLTNNSEALIAPPYSPVNLNQVQMLLTILGTGMAIALTILVLENIVYTYKRNQRRTVRGRILTGNRLSEYRLTMYKSKNGANVIGKWTMRFCSKNAKHRET